MIITPEDSRWLNTLANSYRTEVAQTPVSLQESQAKNLYNIIEGIQTALQVDLTEAQVEALISSLSEGIQRLRRRNASRADIPLAQSDLDRAEEKRLSREIKFTKTAAANMRLTGDNVRDYDNRAEIVARNAMERAQNHFDVASDIDGGRGTPSVKAIEAADRTPGKLAKNRRGENKEKGIKLNLGRPNQTPRGTVPKAPTTAAKADRKVDMDQQNFSR
jgi:hypothetical protein